MTMNGEKRPHVLEAIDRWAALPERQRDADIAWAAGLFDGEGSIGSLDPDRPHYRCPVCLRVVMTSREAIERLHRIFPFSPIRSVPPRGNRSPAWKWSCTHIGYVGYILLMFRRHLTAKAREAQLALDYLGLYDPTPEQGAAFKAALRACKTKPGPRRRAA